MSDFLTVAEVAAICRNDNATVINWIKAGKLRAIKPGQKWLITTVDLVEFLNVKPGADTFRAAASINAKIAQES